MTEINWTTEQLAIFDAVIEQPQQHFLIRALAGTGKSTLLKQVVTEFVHESVAPADVLVLAFNKIIAGEMTSKLPKGFRASTFHSAGFSVLRSHSPYASVDSRGEKVFQAIKSIKGTYGYIARIKELVSWAKNTMTLDRDALEKVAAQKGLADENKSAWDLASIALEVVERSAENCDLVDFDDMIFLPVYHDMRGRTYKHLLIDETQDLNKTQRGMIDLLLHKEGRIIAVGDQNQAIYSWRGAGRNVMNDMQAEFEACVMPLTIGYRCGRKITAVAQEIVPDYKAHENNGEGDVQHANDLDKVQPGDMIIARTNAAGLQAWKTLTEQGIPASIRGKDLAKTLEKMIKSAKVKTCTQLRAWLATKSDALKKVADETEDYEDYKQFQDYADCLHALSVDAEQVSQVLSKLDAIFRDGSKKAQTAVITTVHKAKGLEADRVWVCAPTFRRGETQEEENLWYVAVTRAKKLLVIVDFPTVVDSDDEASEDRGSGLTSLTRTA